MRKWKLKEFVDIFKNQSSGMNKKQLQLFSYQDSENEKAENIWFLSGFDHQKIHSLTSNLFFRAINNKMIFPTFNTYLTPTTAFKSNNEENWNLTKNYLKRWHKAIKPKCVVVFHRATNCIATSSNIPEHMKEQLESITNKTIIDYNNDVTDPTLNKNKDLFSFFNYLTKAETPFINISFENDVNSYFDISETEWKYKIGPISKWLLEEDRFAVPEEKPNFEHDVIPSLELPEAFANL